MLLHVGLNADRFGATTERIEPGEVDHGQHDTARDVFVAPGGATLVRADLFATLGGLRPLDRRARRGPRPLLARSGGRVAGGRRAERARRAPRDCRERPAAR